MLGVGSGVDEGETDPGADQAGAAPAPGTGPAR